MTNPKIVDESDQKIGTMLKIRFPEESVCKSDGQLVEDAATLDRYADRVLSIDQITRCAIKMFRDIEIYRALGGRCPEPPTKWRRFIRPFREAKYRIANAWLALKGHGIASDDY